MLALHTHGQIAGTVPRGPLKLLSLREVLDLETPLERVCLHLPNGPENVDLAAVRGFGIGTVLTTPNHALDALRVGLSVIHSLGNPAVVSIGDVIRVAPNGQIRVLYRRNASSNALFVTERCNSRCLMCSQPPREEDDAWRLAEIRELVPLIDNGIRFLNITGGEPTLLANGLAELIEVCALHLPRTRLRILTNGRNFADPAFVDSMGTGRGRVTWAIPLYADVASIHDYVVQARGAFDATLNGICNLAVRGHRIEIRFVVHAQTLPRIECFVEFLFRNMPFVDHVALMGMEPMGYAKTNRDLLWVDPIDYAPQLSNAAYFLHDRGMAVSIYNVPLCVLPEKAWALARRSISDWKQTYGLECDGCLVQGKCCGFFASMGPQWRSRATKKIARGTKHEWKA